MIKKYSRYKVAIIQNRIIKGGRLQVIIHLIKVLNKLGIIPDLVTQKMRPSIEDITKYYGKNVKFNIKKIFYDIRLPFEFHILFFNFISRFYCKKYDLIINSNNTSFCGPRNKTVLSYVHFPRKERTISKLKSIHFPEGPVKRPYRLKEIFDILAGYLYRFDRIISTNETILANSIYTKNVFLKNFPHFRREIEVIYPPIINTKELKLYTFKKQKDLIISLGRFNRAKRQLEQIKIAEKLAGFNFVLIGFVKKGDDYYQQCLEYIDSNNIQNVTLLNNAPIEEINNWLGKASYFIHNTRNEPFGITTVQALAWNCLPVVHNSGGQVEIVFNPELRFDNVSEAVNIFNEMCKWSDIKRLDLVKELNAKLEKYSVAAFHRKIKLMLINNCFHENN